MSVTVGALFAGYGGLELALAAVLAGDMELAWYAEKAPAPSAVMAHHYPGVPNLGDVAEVEWESVPRVDVLTGGSPCQDISQAGTRVASRGMAPGNRSNLWVSMREAVAVLRPRLVVWENVRGATHANAISNVEPCPGCVGDNPTGVLRALGRVLGDMANLGLDARWCGLRASDVGAPHQRFRIFLVASHPDFPGLERHGFVGEHPRKWLPAEAASQSVLIPTPTGSDGLGGPGGHRGGGPNLRTVAAGEPHDWAKYGPVIARWENLFRPAPEPMEPGRDGQPRLAAPFSEWMMGLPAGWVTDVPGIGRRQQLEMIGNGVHPQQAAAALVHLGVRELVADHGPPIVGVRDNLDPPGEQLAIGMDPDP